MSQKNPFIITIKIYPVDEKEEEEVFDYFKEKAIEGFQNFNIKLNDLEYEIPKKDEQ